MLLQQNDNPCGGKLGERQVQVGPSCFMITAGPVYVHELQQPLVLLHKRKLPATSVFKAPCYLVARRARSFPQG